MAEAAHGQTIDAGRTQLLNQMIDMAHAGPVFGPDVAFGVIDGERRQRIQTQAADIAGAASGQVTTLFEKALPELSSEQTARKTGELIVKATAFVPTLAAAELESPALEKLVPLTVAFCGMYGIDEQIDRGDTHMQEAVERAYASGGAWQLDKTSLAHARLALTNGMRRAIVGFAGRATPDVAPLFEENVLYNELLLQRLSNRYQRVATQFDQQPEFAHRRGDGTENFLRHHGTHIADLMVADAGFQSVTASLHSVYRLQHPELPTIAALHKHPRIQRLIQVSNAVARVADERGDWWMDAGNDPEHGIFSINPFNQPHPAITRRLCELAGITHTDDIAAVQDHFRGFQEGAQRGDAPGRDAHGAAITDHFFDRLRDEYAVTAARLPGKFATYLTLCKRVGEISYVNMLGDIRMGGGTQP